MTELPPRKTTEARPSIISEKNSGGPKRIAQCATTGARKVRPMTPIVPAMKEEIAAMPSAGPARPCLAIS